MNDKKKPFITPTNEKPKSVIDSPLKPDAEMHILVGGPYVQDGENHRYGHTSIRIKTKSYDLTYDFGRYGGVTGDFGAEGEGILRVWKNFSKYIAGENALRRTVGFKYEIFEYQANSVKSFFEAKISAATHLADKDRRTAKGTPPFLQVYKLPENYHALGYNCTTISLDGARQVYPLFEKGSHAFIKPESVLTIAERLAIKTVGGGTPNRIFLPDNLKTFLMSGTATPNAGITNYP